MSNQFLTSYTEVKARICCIDLFFGYIRIRRITKKKEAVFCGLLNIR